MKYRQLGNSGLTASIIGLGTWVLGGGSVWGRDTRDTESIDTIRAALDAGVNLVDTAPAYGWGRSEEVVGKALRGRRDRVLLATKCGLWWDDDRGSYFTEFDGRSLRRSLRPDTIAIEIEASLRRLGTDYIDLYQTHWPSVPPDQTPIADTMDCLLRLKEQGKIRAIGVCNTGFVELATHLRHGPVATNQFRYSLLHRAAEADLLPMCAQNNVGTLTYMSLEQGLLTGRIGLGHRFGNTEFRGNADWNPWFTPPNRRRVLDLLASWTGLTEKYECTPGQLATAWTTSQPGVTHVLIGARSAAQARENAQAGELELEADDLGRMRGDAESLGEPVRDHAQSI